MYNTSSVSLENDIKYYDECLWKDYLHDIIRVKHLSGIVIMIYDKLKGCVEQNKDKPLEFLNQYPGLFNIVFGGLRSDPNKPFEEHSLSRFYYDIYSIGFNEDTAAAIVRELEKGDISDKVFRNPRFKLGQLKQWESEAISIIKWINSLSEAIYNELQDIEICGIKVSETDREIGNEINKIYKEKCHDFINSTDNAKIYCGVYILEELLNQCIKLLPQYNTLSWFLLSLKSNIDLYVEEYYPTLWKHQEKETEVLNKLRLRIEIIPISGVKGINNLKVDVSKGIGRSINLINYIFRLFQLNYIHKYFNSTDFYKNYVLDFWNTLNKSSILNDIIKLLREQSTLRRSIERWSGEYNSLKLPDEFSCYRITDWTKLVDKNISAEDLFNVITPFMMYGLAYYDLGPIYIVLKDDLIKQASIM